jgi:hypothetical protein
MNYVEPTIWHSSGNWYDMVWYDMIYDMIYHIWYDMIRYDTIWYDTIRYDIFVNCNLVDTRWHLHTINTENKTMKQNTQKGTWIAIRIHKHNNKKTWFTKLNRSIQNRQPYIQWYKEEPKEC